MIPNIHVLAIYIIAIIFVYIYARLNIESMARRRVLTKTGEREAVQMLDRVMLFFTVLGILVILANASEVILSAAIILAAIVLSMGDLFKSIIAYYMVLFSKIVEYGSFVVMSRGVRGWVRRINTFFTEIQGEHGEIIRIPNTLVVNDVIRMPVKAVPITFLLIIKGEWKNLDDIAAVIRRNVDLVKRLSVGSPHFKPRAVSSNKVEYELTFWIHSTETAGEILKTLAPKLINEFKGMGLDAEIKIERIAAVAHM